VAAWAVCDLEAPATPELGTLIELLSEHAIELSEPQLIALPFCCELFPELKPKSTPHATEP
jgi:hypothetical protein